MRNEDIVRRKISMRHIRAIGPCLMQFAKSLHGFL